MRSCPNCASTIKWFELIKISRHTPIRCQHCHAQVALVHPNQMVLGFVCVLPSLILMVCQSWFNEFDVSMWVYGVLLILGIAVYFKKVPLR